MENRRPTWFRRGPLRHHAEGRSHPESAHGCSFDPSCVVGKPWQKINKAVNDVLQNINLAEMSVKNESQNLINLTNVEEVGS